MTNNGFDSDPNFHNIPCRPSHAIIPFLPNPNLQFTLSPSYDHSPRKKCTKALASFTSSSSLKSSSKPKYTKKPDPNASKITRPCTECGKQFWSLKALFGHMRCHPERQWRGINPPPNHHSLTGASSKQNQRSPNWVSFMSKEDHEVASCLLMLSNATPFDCGCYKKVFGSHQTLGGHRTSHKIIKECFAITNITDDHQEKIITFSGHHHKCNLCFREFSSGQALGGHMRCHLERQEEIVINGGVLNLNVPEMIQDLSTSDTCSLDLRLGL